MHLDFGIILFDTIPLFTNFGTLKWGYKITSADYLKNNPYKLVIWVVSILCTCFLDCLGLRARQDNRVISLLYYVDSLFILY
jgi:hypothetical protein